MSDPFLGEIRLFAHDSDIPGWARCDGRLMRTSTNTALFSLIGFTYGGSWPDYFALPNLSGKTVIHAGPGHEIADESGMDAVALWPAMMPAHTHNLMVSTVPGNTPEPSGHVLADPVNPLYAAPARLVALNGDSVTSTGGGQAHENRQPYIVLNYYIAVAGLFIS
jgi:microcystin-dependent protein